MIRTIYYWKTEISVRLVEERLKKNIKKLILVI